MPAALPPDPPQAAIVITGKAVPEAKSERVYAVERIDRRRIEQPPSHELDQLLKDVPGQTPGETHGSFCARVEECGDIARIAFADI